MFERKDALLMEENSKLRVILGRVLWGIRSRIDACAEYGSIRAQICLCTCRDYAATSDWRLDEGITKSKIWISAGSSF